MGYVNLSVIYETHTKFTKDIVAYTKLARTQRDGAREDSPSFGKEEERREATEAEGG